jgi:hypothetical protein
MSRRKFAAVALLVWLPGFAGAATVAYTDERAFLAAVGRSITDDYTNTGYRAVAATLTDARMSAVLGETTYVSTGWSDGNIVNQSLGYYCAGCNGSFRLSFASTSVGDARGVYGAGLRFANSATLPYHAFVTFGDRSTADYTLPAATNLETMFFALSSDLRIMSIHLGLEGGRATRAGGFSVFSLTIGAPATTTVPLPAAIWLLLSGAGALAALCRRRPRAA